MIVYEKCFVHIINGIRYNSGKSTRNEVRKVHSMTDQNFSSKTFNLFHSAFYNFFCIFVITFDYHYYSRSSKTAEELIQCAYRNITVLDTLLCRLYFFQLAWICLCDFNFCCAVTGSKLCHETDAYFKINLYSA